MRESIQKDHKLNINKLVPDASAEEKEAKSKHDFAERVETRHGS